MCNRQADDLEGDVRAAAGHFADHFVHPLDPLGIHGLGCAQFARPSQFVINQIDRDDLRSQRGGDLHHVQPHAATAKDNDCVAGHHPPAIHHRVIGRGYGVSDDAAFHQRDFLWQRQSVFGGRKHIFGIAAIDVVAEHHHSLADILAPFAAQTALAAAVNGGKQHAVTFAPCGHIRAERGDGAGDLVPQNQGWLFESGRSVIQIVQIRVAQTAPGHFDQDFICSGRGGGDFFDTERLIRCFEDCGFHY